MVLGLKSTNFANFIVDLSDITESPLLSGERKHEDKSLFEKNLQGS